MVSNGSDPHTLRCASPLTTPAFSYPHSLSLVEPYRLPHSRGHTAGLVCKRAERRLYGLIASVLMER
jgi:hypothetical protein